MARPIRNLATLILLSALGPKAHAGEVRAYLRNQEGILKLQAKAFYPAYQAFMRALEEDPLNPAIQMNLGLAFEANEEYDKAEQTYKGVLSLVPANSELSFDALFNLGGALAKQQKYDEALAVYQMALAIHPDSKEVKTNIELLWQQGGGGGQGENKDNKDKKDKKGGDKDKDQKPGDGDKKDQKKNGQDGEEQKEQKKQPKPFESQDLTPQDVKKILDEIKNQEQSIRAEEYERNAKEAPRGKDW